MLLRVDEVSNKKDDGDHKLKNSDIVLSINNQTIGSDGIKTWQEAIRLIEGVKGNVLNFRVARNVSIESLKNSCNGSA